MNEIKDGIVLHTEVNTKVSFDLSGYPGYKILQNPKYGNLIVRKTGQLQYTPKTDFKGTDLIRFAFKDQKENVESIALINVTENFFKPRARLLLQLGDQLIRNESIALIELVKNAYDADSSRVNVSMQNVDKPKKGSITIEDNGYGMDIETIKKSWLEPGSDNKEKQLKERSLTPKFKRLPIGEKGIGRFGVHKLGKHIELVTRRKDYKEVTVSIDWETFTKHHYLSDAPITIVEREPEVFKGNKTGTKIVISNLHKEWTRGLVRDVYRAINALSTPADFSISDKGKIDYLTKPDFSVEFNIDNPEWIKDIPSWKDISDYSLFHFDIRMEGTQITKFRYKFVPWGNMTRVNGRFVTEKKEPISKDLEIIAALPDSRKKTETINLDDYKIGPVEFRGSIFIRDKSILKLALNQISPLSDYLDANGGIKVYRSGMRIYDYGEPGNDWIGLDYNRFNNPSIKVSNNMIIASVNIQREESTDLIEKTNREGFIENNAYNTFKKAIEHSLRLVEMLRRQDKDKIDANYRLPRQFEPVLKSIDSLKAIVDKKVKDPAIKKEIKAIVDRVEQNYKFMNDTLAKTATVGAGWSIYIHEIEKIILEIEKVIKSIPDQGRLTALVEHLSKIIENYAQILRKTNRKSESISKIIDQSLFNIEFRLKAHKVEVVRPPIKKDFHVNVARSLIIGTLMNLIDNSIYWLERSNNTQKKIYLDVVEDKGFINLLLADNGPGFSLPFSELLEPFVTTKPDGMGMGLNIAKEIIVSHDGKLDSNERGDFKLPKEFAKGACIILSFKK
jgi:signal transduction histidine kinase